MGSRRVWLESMGVASPDLTGEWVKRQPRESGTVALFDSGARHSSDRLISRSDCGVQLVECGRDSEIPAPGITTEFVVTSPEVLHERVSSDDHAGSPVGLQSADRFQS